MDKENSNLMAELIFMHIASAAIATALTLLVVALSQ